MKKKALGKGIGALIPTKESNIKGRTTDIKTSLISSSRLQPRMKFDPQRHKELVASIKEKGIMQPIIVRPAKGEKDQERFELIAGERRLRAMKELGFEEIPAIIKEVNDAEALEISLIENIQREELNAIEEAHAYEKLMDEFELTQDEIAKAVGKDRSTISNILRLLKLPEKIQDYVSRGTLSMGHARALLSMVDSDKQIALANEMVKKGVSVREAEALVKLSPKRHKIKVKKEEDPHIKEAEEKLQHILGTKVTIIHGKKRGRIQIDYYTSNDLERLINLLGK